MAEQLHLVDQETCNGDGICVAICPENVLELVDGKASTVVETWQLLFKLVLRAGF